MECVSTDIASAYLNLQARIALRLVEYTDALIISTKYQEPNNVLIVQNNAEHVLTTDSIVHHVLMQV